MGAYLRLTPATKDVLQQLHELHEETWGLQLARLADRPTGTVYPLLDRLEREGFVASRWETDSGRVGPRRRLYTLTSRGREWVRHKLKLNPEDAS